MDTKCWTSIYTGWLMTVGQQSGKANRASRANQAIRFSRAHCNRAMGQSGTVGPIGQIAESIKSGSWAVEQVGQSGKSDQCWHHSTTRHWHRLCSLPDWPDCSTGQSEGAAVYQIGLPPDWCQIRFPSRASRAVERQSARLPLATQKTIK